MARWTTAFFGVAAALLVFGKGPVAYAEDAGWGAFSPSINDYGTTGLVQMPSGRMHPDGSFAFGFSRNDPYTRFYLTTQILPWLQGTFRYTDIAYASYGIVDTQSYKDKAIDFKVRLVREGPDFPEISLGFRDVGGTGVFSSEYIAASRRFYSLDFTGGIAWGNMGSRGHLPNPLGFFSERAKVRPSTDTTGTPGTLSTSFFRGENIGVFGGVEWQTPIEGLRLKAEYDSNNYQQEFQNTQLEVTSPINVAVGYQPFPWLDISVGYERGNSLMFRGALLSNFNKDAGVPKLDEKPPLPVADAPGAQGSSDLPRGTAMADDVTMNMVDATVDSLFDTMQARNVHPASIDLAAPIVTIHLLSSSSAKDNDLSAVGLAIAQMPTLTGVEKVVFRKSDGTLLQSLSTTRLLQRQATLGHVSAPQAALLTQEEMARRFFEALDYYGFTGYRFALEGNRATVVYGQSSYSNLTIAAGRVARALALVTPESVTTFDLMEEVMGVPVSRVVFNRKDVLRAALKTASVDELWLNAQTPPPEALDLDWVENGSIFPKLDWGLAPRLRQNIGGPNNFYLYQIYADASATVSLTPNWNVTGNLAFDLLNNYEGFTYDAPSNMPRVRTYLRRYLIDSPIWIDSLTTNYVTTLAPNWYGRVSAGVFELMYGGIDGEVLYRPAGKRWALGLDINHVWQRDYDGLFGFQDYNITTGHLTWYHSLPVYGLEGSLSVGRYLAGDVGATITLGRRFENGMRIGAWATKTNVSAEEFGEGAFDKGIYVTIPFNLFTTSPTKSTGGIAFRPLTRDGGARLDLPMSLYGITGDGGGSTTGWQDSMK